jgi:protease-4
VFLLVLPAQGMAASGPDLLEVVELTGEIHDGTASSLQSNVETINDNAKVKAVLLVVKSPGGGVLATAEVYRALSKLKVPVVGWCSGMCASGGLYALMAPSVKFIAVSSDAISGSVGVVMQSTRFNRLLDYLKIDSEIFQSGELKAAGNSTRNMTKAEREYLQGMVTEFADGFFAVVAKARPNITDWSQIKSARVFIGRQAVEIGLVDAVMTRDEVIKKAKALSESDKIYTRDELKKMSRAADEHRAYHLAQPPVRSDFGDIPALVEMLKEIRAGQSVRFGYRLPIQFLPRDRP